MISGVLLAVALILAAFVGAWFLWELCMDAGITWLIVVPFACAFAYKEFKHEWQLRRYLDNRKVAGID